jgi:hypothetical protein
MTPCLLLFTSLPFLFYHCVRFCVCSCQISPSRKHKSSSSNGRKSSKGQGAKKAAKVRYVTCSPYVTLVIVRQRTLLIHPDLHLFNFSASRNSLFPLPLSNSLMVKNSSASILFIGVTGCTVMYSDALYCAKSLLLCRSSSSHAFTWCPTHR